MAHGSHGFDLWPELFGKPVSLDDKSKTVLIWSETNALQNKGRCTPTEITQKAFEKAAVFQAKRKNNNESIHSYYFKRPLVELVKSHIPIKMSNLTVQIGQRVGAICSKQGNHVEFFGYGVYEGNIVPDNESVLFMGISLKKANISNPQIKLDNGDVVYGCECWWGSEEKVQEMLKGCEIFEKRISEYRSA